MPPFPLPRPVQGRVRDQVADWVRSAIVDGRLMPATALGLPELERSLGVSRTPLRAALDDLAELGLVRIVPQSGTMVAPVQLEEVRGYVHVLEVLTSAALIDSADLQPSPQVHLPSASDDAATMLLHLARLAAERLGNRLVTSAVQAASAHLQRALNVGCISKQPTDEHELAQALHANSSATAIRRTVAELAAAASVDLPAMQRARASEPTLIRRLLRNDLYETLVRRIVNGELVAGTRLPEAQLGRDQGVSRTTVQHALQRLGRVGLVELEPRRAARVASFDPLLTNEALYLTGVAHEAAARLTIPGLSDDDRRLLVDAAEGVQAALDGDLAAIGPEIGHYFLVFEQLTGNEQLVDLVDSMSPTLLRFLTPREGFRSVGSIVNAIHRITSASLIGDAQRAGDLIHQLYEPTRTAWAKAYRPQVIATKYRN